MALGQRVAGRFEPMEIAGSGGMGVVYRAFDHQTQTTVALKVLRSWALSGGPSIRERFAREARALLQIRHPAVVGYVAHGATDEGDLFLAMEWLTGEDLSKRLARGVLSPDETVTLGMKLADALGAVHRCSLVHRDLKPGNVFLVDGRVDDIRLLDFGLVRILGGAPALTSANTVLGTPAYMAPEQTRAGRPIDARSDVYSLGCLLFECVTGQPPFTGENSFAVLAKIAFDDPPRPTDLRPDLPPAFDFAIGRMLAKEPSERLADGAAVTKALAALAMESGERERDGGEGAMRALTRNEQRLVSILIASRAMLPSAARHDSAVGPPSSGPETFAQAPPDAELRAIVERHGGELRELPDGAVAALFTGASSATDLAVSAARCALVIRESRPHARIALATGRGLLSTRLPLGEAIDRAARLIRSTESRADDTLRIDGVIKTDDVTAGLLGTRFNLTEDDGAFELVGALDRVDATRTLLGRPTTCVGRAQELGALLGAFEACTTEPGARAVLVTGAAGVGKSRLRYEVVEALRGRTSDAEVWIARGDPMSAGAPFAMMAGALLRAAGAREGEPIESRRRKLRARVARNVPARDVQRVTEFLGEIVGVPFADRDSMKLRAARQDATLIGDQVRRAWEELLLAEVSARPFVLVLDDLHWGDMPTIKLVDAALRQAADKPFFALALARPEVHELFPDLWRARAVLEIRLGALSPRASTSLVREVLGASTRPDVVERIVEQAAGNAFYLEELIRAEAEGRRGAPGTVLAMVQARLEELELGPRHALRAASVFGEVFWAGGVRALVEGGAGAPTRTITDCLSNLAEREIVVERRHSRFPSEIEYVFRHALVREAAYGMLTDSDRVLGHKVAGEWLAGAGEHDATVLAEHFERGKSNARAIEWYLKSAQRALAANDLGAVVVAAQKALACGANGESLGALRAMEAEAHNWRGEPTEGESCALEAMELSPPESADWWIAAQELVTALSALGKKDALSHLAERIAARGSLGELRGEGLRAVARLCRALIVFGRADAAHPLLSPIEAAADAIAASEPASFGWLCMARSARAYFTGDLGELLRQTEAGIACFERVDDARNACLLRGDAGFATIELGLFEQAERVLRRGLEVAEAMGIRNVAATARQNLGQALAYLGRVDEAIRVEEASCAEFHAADNRRMECASRLFLAQIRLLARDPARAVDDARAAVELARSPTPLAAMEAHALAVLARAELATGDKARSLATSNLAMGILAKVGEGVDGESIVRLSHAEALRANGDEAGARAAIAVARDRLLARAHAIGDVELRRSFLENVADNARTLAFG